MASARTATEQSPRLQRVSGVDAVRGIVIAIMALDHTREFFHSGAMQFSPEDLSRTWTALFLTRWVTHICAPAFMLLAGLSAFLWRSRGRTAPELSRFLLTRGLWLILLDLVVMRVAMFFSLTSGPVILSVLWALGWSMIVLSALVRLPVSVLAPVSAAVIVLHNLLDGISASQFGSAAWMWNMLHQAGVFSAGGVIVLVAYPLVPWIAVMAFGYCLGPLFEGDPGERKRALLFAGAAMIAAFVLLRAIDRYGDPRQWQAGALSFLNTTKYPPSLQFLLMTLGPTLILLALFGNIRAQRANPLIAFGRTPLFFFVAHFYLIHALTFVFAAFRYDDIGFLWQPAPSMGGSLEQYPARYGWSLVTVYVVWILVLCAMYPACRWFAGVKERRRDWWVSYV